MTFRAGHALTRLFYGAAEPDHYFRALADQLDDALLLVYPRSGVIAEVNHAATVLTGYSRPELCSLSLHELIDGEAAPGPLYEIRNFASAMTRTLLDVPLQTHSGKPLHADLRLLPLDDDPSRPALLIFAANSQHRLEAQRRAKLLPNLVQSMLNLAQLSLDPPQGALEESLRIGGAMMAAHACGIYRISVDPPLLKLAAGVGLPESFPLQLPAQDSPAMVSPMAWSSAIRPDTTLSRAARSAGWGSMLAVPLGESSGQLGTLFVGYRGGETPPAEAALVLQLLAQHVYQLLRQMARTQGMLQMREDLNEKTSLAEAFIGNTREIILIADSDQRVTRANQAAEQALGYSQAELMGSRVLDVLVSPHDLTFAIQDALLNGRTTDDQEMVVHRRTGESFPASVRVGPVFDQNIPRRPNAAMLLVSDISKHKAIESRSQQLEQRALLGEVSAIFAHEVRNPLNNITAGVQLLSSRLDADHPLQATAAKIMTEASRLAQLMKDVLDFSKPLQLCIAPNDLGDIVRRVLTRWTAKMSRQRIQLHSDVRPDTPAALIDPRSIEQVITNLVDNAIQAMPDGGTLSVTLSAAPRAQTGEAVLLRITDTGGGMTEEVRRRIFDPFFTTKATGTGLGLSITKHIVSANNGSLKVESFPGIGSTFWVTLPAAAGLEVTE